MTDYTKEMSDLDVYDVLKEMGIITDDLMTRDEFIIWKQLIDEGKNEEEALMITKSYTSAKEIIDKNIHK